MIDRHVYLLAAALFGIALAVFTYKTAVLGVPVDERGAPDAWDIEVQIEYDAIKQPVKASLYLPQTEGRFEIANEHFISGQHGLVIRQYKVNRRAVWSQRQAAGRQYLLYRASVHPLPISRQRKESGEPEVRPPDWEESRLAAGRDLLEAVQAHSADLHSLVSLLLLELGKGKASDRAALVLNHDYALDNRAAVAAELLQLQGIAARLVNGYELEPLARSAHRVYWLEVYRAGQWLAFDPRDGSDTLPGNYLPWWRDTKPFFTLEGGTQPTTRISITRSPRSLLQRGAEEESGSWLLDYSLLSLPVEARAVYHVLLMIPVGVVLLVVMRNIVGIKTFGTFMPVLIAMAFRETRLLWGIALFVLIVGLGLAMRFYLDRLKLLLVPRLAAVLIVVILLMIAISILSHQFGLPRGLSISLFPMVILTMTIERMSIVWEERGRREALEQGLGSLVVAALAYSVMTIEALGHFIFIFPETLLLFLAVVILLGRYTGYRLSELVRFRALGEGR